jgi:hypothetical protein
MTATLVDSNGDSKIIHQDRVYYCEEYIARKVREAYWNGWYEREKTMTVIHKVSPISQAQKGEGK